MWISKICNWQCNRKLVAFQIQVQICVIYPIFLMRTIKFFTVSAVILWIERVWLLFVLSSWMYMVGSYRSMVSSRGWLSICGTSSFRQYFSTTSSSIVALLISRSLVGDSSVISTPFRMMPICFVPKFILRAEMKVRNGLTMLACLISSI